MEQTYQVTAEMLGLSWQRLFRLALVRSILYLLGALLFSIVYNHGWGVPMGVGASGVVVDFLATFLLRPFAPSNLRVTDNSIEEADGPIIRKDDVIGVREHSDQECSFHMPRERGICLPSCACPY